MAYWFLDNDKEKVYLLFYITERSNSDVSERNRSFGCTLFRVTVNVTRNKYYHCRSYAIYYNVLYIWKKRWMPRRNDRVYYLIFLVTAMMSTVIQSIITFSNFRERNLINYSLYRRLANFQKEEVYNPPDSYIIKFNKTEATAITNFPRSSFYQKASRTWIINITISICTFKDLQSATSIASLPSVDYCSRRISGLSNR